MVRKCSHCGNVGHNSRTCTIQKHKETKFKLFGVQLIENGTTHHHHYTTLLKKSISLDSLPSSSSSASSSSSSLSSSSSSEKLSNGYLSDGLIVKTHERKKGVPWSEEEHRVFLVGLEKLGKGDWRGISRKFVTTRTPTQVASHAQKYFLRLTTLNKRKHRRPSLFDGAAARDKLTVQVVEKGSSSSNNNNLKPTNINNIQPASSNNISFGNPTPFQNISKLSNLNWFDHHDNQHHHEPYFKFLQSPINKSSSSIMINNFQTTTNHHHHHHRHQPDLQLSLSTPKPVLEQVAQ